MWRPKEFSQLNIELLTSVFRQITRFAQPCDHNSRYDPAVVLKLNMAEEGGVSVNEIGDGVKKDKVDIYRDTPLRYLGVDN